MKEKALVAFKSKLFNPCKQFLRLFKFKFKKPIGLQFRRHHRRGSTPLKSSNRRKKRFFRPLLSIFHSSYWKRKEEEVVENDHDRVEDKIGELKSMTDAGRERLLFPSPITPIYNTRMKRGGDHKKEGGADDQDEVEDACRSFENYLTEMIVNEGKVRDLNDVEELLYCWKNLKSPVFVDLVCRFYGELCKDLFSSGRDQEQDAAVADYSNLR